MENKKIALVIGSKERYVFSSLEWDKKGLFINGPFQLPCWNDVNIKLHPMMWIRSINYDYPSDKWSSRDIELSINADIINREYNYGAIQNIFVAIADKSVDWEMPTYVDFHLDDENGLPGYTNLQNFHATCYLYDTVFPNHSRNWGKEYLEMVGVEASETPLINL